MLLFLLAGLSSSPPGAQKQRNRATALFGRWDPPAVSQPSSALEDLMREAAAVESGAVVADDRISLVELPFGATGIEWGSDLSFVGVYVREVEKGGAAERSGLVFAGDQLVAINGTSTYQMPFDQVMSLLGRGGSDSIKLEFFSGSRDELLSAAGISVATATDCTIVVRDGSREVAQLSAAKGSNLRDVLVEAGLDVYRGTTKWTNCNGKQMCGTCIVEIDEGADQTNRKSNDEAGTLNLQQCSGNSRLSCVTYVYGDVTVSLQPDRKGGFFGSATSGSAW